MASISASSVALARLIGKGVGSGLRFELHHLVINALIPFRAGVRGMPLHRETARGFADRTPLVGVENQVLQNGVDAFLRRRHQRTLLQALQFVSWQIFPDVHVGDDGLPEHHAFARRGAISPVVELIDNDVHLRVYKPHIYAWDIGAEDQPHRMALQLESLYRGEHSLRSLDIAPFFAARLIVADAVIDEDLSFGALLTVFFGDFQSRIPNLRIERSGNRLTYDAGAASHVVQRRQGLSENDVAILPDLDSPRKVLCVITDLRTMLPRTAIADVDGPQRSRPCRNRGLRGRAIAAADRVRDPTSSSAPIHDVLRVFFADCPWIEG